MTDNTEKIVGNDGPGYLLTLNEKEYRADLLCDFNRTEFTTWIRERTKDDVYKELARFGPEVYVPALKDVAAQIGRGDFDWGGAKWAQEINSRQGRIRITWILLKRRQPKLDEIDLRNALDANPEVNYQKVADMINSLLGNSKAPTT